MSVDLIASGDWDIAMIRQRGTEVYPKFPAPSQRLVTELMRLHRQSRWYQEAP